jgi:hypothetical protein
MDTAIDAVATAGRMVDLADELLAIEVRRARAVGATWDDIGEALGRSRQAVQKRFGAVVPITDRDPTRPGKGSPTLGALQTRDIEMKCVTCGKVKPGSKFPTVRRQRPGEPVREERCRACRDSGRS